MSDHWDGRVALVTGASAGIGAAIVKRFAQLGLKVIGCARNIDKIKVQNRRLVMNYRSPTRLVPSMPLNVMYHKRNKSCLCSKKSKRYMAELMFVCLFVCLNGRSVWRHAWVLMGPGSNVCVNNAGVNHATSIIDGKTEDWKHIFDVNVLGLSICTREAVKSMRERNVDDGHIIHINSLSGHRVVPASVIHVYSASKYAVTALTEGLRQELREIKSHIRVTSISPGLVKSEFTYRAYGQEAGQALYDATPSLQADDIVDAVVYALQAPPHVQVHDILIRNAGQTS
ncbi:dehydrogenase/reductase SDR family member 11-like [Amphiura filiformis]|uniref:dehydrogenase/reductase SDR family member 11-like n=1 Tax=Amphiura filiformis TaxID=82378 RepID=UPI003B211A21